MRTRPATQRMLHAAAGLGVLFGFASAQPGGVACCTTKGLAYGRGYCDVPLSEGVSSWDDVATCWALAKEHFGNKTQSDKYQIFLMLVSSEAGDITKPPPAPALKFDADILPVDGDPELGYLPYKFQIVFPEDDNNKCMPATLKNWDIEFSMHRGANTTDRTYHPMTFTFAGCGRDVSVVEDLKLSSLGFANPEFNFLTLRNSKDITSIEFVSQEGVAETALDFQEAAVENCRLRYFGDVAGDLGQTFGRTQNGTSAKSTSFEVEDPRKFMPFFRYRKEQPYTFSWVGSMHKEPEPEDDRQLVHLADSYIEYIRDVALGTVDVRRCHFVPWTSKANPVVSGEDVGNVAPSISVYRADQGGESGKAYGSMVRDSTLEFLWGTDIMSSATLNSTFHWRDWRGSGMPPRSWEVNETRKPTFVVALSSSDAQAGFEQNMTSSQVCLRPAAKFASGATVEAQQLSLDKDSKTPRTHFFNGTDARCTSVLASEVVPLVV